MRMYDIIVPKRPAPPCAGLSNSRARVSELVSCPTYLQDSGNRRQQRCEIARLDHERRHQVDDVAERSDPDAVFPDGDDVDGGCAAGGGAGGPGTLLALLALVAVRRRRRC